MVPEARLEPTEHGLVPRGEGWFVLNARDARWLHAEGRPAVCEFEGEPTFAQIGINLCVLHVGEPMAMYHWEDDQEDFLVLAGEALLVVEGQERRLRRWDLVHCPPRTDHVIVGAGDGPCLVLALGAHEHPRSGGFRSSPSRCATGRVWHRRRATPSGPTRAFTADGRRNTARAGFPTSASAGRASAMTHPPLPRIRTDAD